ncbi:MAG: right-handed parallel beta-helix repeat-containing protein [Opitutales bacterium]
MFLQLVIMPQLQIPVESSVSHSPNACACASGWTIFKGAALFGCFSLLAATAFANASVYQLVEAAHEGDVIELPAGTFELDRPLLIDKRLALVGQGRDETILRSTAGEEGVLIRIQGIDGARLAGFTLDGAGNENISQGIVLSGGSGHLLEDLRIRDIPGTGGFGPHAIHASSNVIDSRFAGLEIRNIGLDSEWGAGLRMGEGSRGNLIEENDLTGFGRGGILTTRGSTDTIIRNNRVRDFGHAGPGLGIEVWGNGERVVIEDNIVDHWISVDGQEDVAVRRNRITGAEDEEHIGSYGLELVNSSRVVMTDNVMEGGNHIGLSVSNRARKDLAYWARNQLLSSETWGAQIQGEEGGAHRMYFYENEFVQTKRSERSLYPGAAGHGFRFNGNAFQMVLHANRILNNEGAGVQMGGENLDRLSFIGNSIADNRGAAITGTFQGEAVAWEGNETSRNQGGDGGLESRGFDEWNGPELSIEVSGETRSGETLTLELNGFADELFSAVLWDLGHGIPMTGDRVEHVYDHSGEYRTAAIAWTHGGRGIRVEAELTITE